MDTAIFRKQMWVFKVGFIIYADKNPDSLKKQNLGVINLLNYVTIIKKEKKTHKILL